MQFEVLLVKEVRIGPMRKYIRKLRNQDGLSLLEVLIAMILTSVSLLILLNLAMVALDSNDWSSQTTASTQIMQQQLEQVRTLNEPPGTYNDTVGEFELSYTIDSVAAFLKQVTMEITWEDIRGKTQVDTMSSFFKTP